jgi:hypothetical protein
MNTQTEPKLAPPGAGLPKIELYVARLMFTVQRLTGNRHSFNARFQNERELIRKLLHSCKESDGSRRVLIKRIPGLEDSSRYWSVWMTLDHLRIVNGGITRTIGALTKGKRLEGAASTAAVKPNPQATAAAITEYEKSCDELLATVAANDNLKTDLRFSHPWFGPLDAAGWHAMASTHLGIHRVQIERILSGLRQGNTG